MALSVETSELVEEFQWLTEAQAAQVKGDPVKLTKVSDEVADVAIYLIRLVDKLGIDLEKAIAIKIEQNESKYPADKVRGSAKKYNQYD
jgi:NTP pyrophosphatase (non-canonical NTP hydrolase)